MNLNSKLRKKTKRIEISRYEDIWKYKDDVDNPHERYYKDIIEREKMVKIEQEIRNVVDEMMRSELELLQAAYDRDRTQKGKKAKKPQKKVESSSIWLLINQFKYLILYSTVIDLASLFTNILVIKINFEKFQLRIK